MKQKNWKVRISPSHLLGDPEIRALYQPNEKVELLPETLQPQEFMGPDSFIGERRFFMVNIVKASGRILPIDLMTLSLTRRQKRYLMESGVLPRGYFNHKLKIAAGKEDCCLSDCQVFYSDEDYGDEHSLSDFWEVSLFPLEPVEPAKAPERLIPFVAEIDEDIDWDLATQPLIPPKHLIPYAEALKRAIC